MKTHSFLRDELKLSAAVTLVVCTLASGSLLYGEIGGGGEGRKKNPTIEEDDDDSRGSGGGGNQKVTRCYHQVIPCEKMKQSCRMLPYALELSCSDDRCKNGSLCMVTTTVGNPGDDGYSLFLKSICNLTVNPCSPFDQNCLATPVISQVSCSDSRCSNQLITVTGTSMCERTRVIVDRDGNVVGRFSGWTPAEEQNGTSGGSTGGTSGGSNNIAGGGNNSISGDVPGIFGTTSGGSTGGDKPVITGDSNNKDGPARGCFTRNGVWTTDRAFCDPDQGRFLGGQRKEQVDTSSEDSSNEKDSQDEAEQETEIRRLVEEKFRSKEECDVQLQSLLATTTDAIERLSLLVNRQVLPVETAQHVQAMIDWLKQVMTTYSLGDYSLEQIHGEAVRVHKSLEDTQFLITHSLEQSGVSLARDPNSLLSKTDRIFSAIPTVLSLLQEQQVPVAPEALTVYQEASALYEEIKPVCLQDPDQCLRLVGVVERLQQMMDTLRASMNTAGRSDLEEKINILFQQM